MHDNLDSLGIYIIGSFERDIESLCFRFAWGEAYAFGGGKEVVLLEEVGGVWLFFVSEKGGCV